MNKTSFRKGNVPWNKGLRAIKTGGRPSLGFKVLVCPCCDKKFNISVRRLNDKRMKVKHYCSIKCRAKMSNFKGGTITSNGYRAIYVGGIQTLEHRYIMEKIMQRKLTKKEHVHHINRNTLDNTINNLIVIDVHDHGKIHGGERYASA